MNIQIELKEFPTHIAKTHNKIKENKLVKINNQAIYNSNLNRFARNIVMTNLHTYLKKSIRPYKKEFTSVGIPLKIRYEFHTVKNHGAISYRSGKLCWKYPKKEYVPNWDIENLATIWIKAINDTLSQIKCIPDDTIEYVDSISYSYKPVEHLEDRKIIIHITT